MKEPTSPFALYGQLMTTYVNACLKANRAWFESAAAFASAFAPLPPARAAAPAEPPAARGAPADLAVAAFEAPPDVSVAAPVIASMEVSSLAHALEPVVAFTQAPAIEPGSTAPAVKSVPSASGQPVSSAAAADPDILAAVREVVQLAPESATPPAPKSAATASPKRGRRAGLRRKP